ncbi:MAG TPA: hypothetical protein PKB10_15665, partial [Tepidisphaeraceae bacterium]|nr:hypothetical protein [Tepidisphaeraceae bacterium]
NLPTGAINGFDSSQITWVYGARVVDLASAVNVNTALTSLSDFRRDGYFPTVGPLVSGAFPSHVELFRLLRQNAWRPARTHLNDFISYPDNTLNDFGRLLNFTLNTPAVYLVSGLAESDGDAPTSGAGINPRDDSNTDRSDWIYFSLGDALHQGLARRIENPGYADNAKRFRAYPLSNEFSLVSRFAIAPPTATTQLDRDLTDSIVTNVRQTPYAANDIVNWFNQNFAFALDPATPTPTNASSRRALLTTQSRTSNLAPYPGPTGPTIPPLTMGPALPDGTSGFNTRTMPRTSINSATFDEKWRAFFLVMAEPEGTVWRTPYGLDDEAYSRANMFTGMTFGAPPPSNPNDPMPPVLSAPTEPQTPALFDPPPTSVAANDQHRYRMFRSSTRTPPPATGTTHTFIEPSEMMKLRSAIAARGVADQYDGDIDVSHQVINLNVFVNGTRTPAQAVVFGNERQPVIASVYANTNISPTLPPGATGQNTQAYVAIKLFNPSHDKYV